jgi:hypothetical protein
MRRRGVGRVGMKMRELGRIVQTDANIGPELRQVTPADAGGRPRDSSPSRGGRPAQNPADDVRSRAFATEGFLLLLA